VCGLWRRTVLATSEVVPLRAERALKSEGRELPHLEVVARGGCGTS
jgi:hypothetical protein